MTRALNWPAPCFLERYGARTSQLTLRISTQQTADTTSIILEGRIAGPWVAELGRTWSEISLSLGNRKVSINLCNATYADENGISILRTIYNKTAAKLITSTPWTEYLAGEVTRVSATPTD